MEAVEQRTGVEADDALRVAGGDRCAQVVEIAGDVGRLEEQSVARRGDGVVAERGAEDVDREVEQTSRARRVLLRPEQRQRAVAREWLRPAVDDEREQGDAMALRRRAKEGTVWRTQAGAPQGLK